MAAASKPPLHPTAARVKKAEGELAKEMKIRNRKILQEVEAGKSSRDIGPRFGVAHQRVSQIAEEVRAEDAAEKD